MKITRSGGGAIFLSLPCDTFFLLLSGLLLFVAFAVCVCVCVCLVWRSEKRIQWWYEKLL